jgi:hypothetical protein
LTFRSQQYISFEQSIFNWKLTGIEFEGLRSCLIPKPHNRRPFSLRKSHPVSFPLLFYLSMWGQFSPQFLCTMCTERHGPTATRLHSPNPNARFFLPASTITTKKILCSILISSPFSNLSSSQNPIPHILFPCSSSVGSSPSSFQPSSSCPCHRLLVCYYHHLLKTAACSLTGAATTAGPRGFVRCASLVPFVRGVGVVEPMAGRRGAIEPN